MFSFLSSLCILEISPLSDVELMKIIFSFCRHPFCLSGCASCFIELLSFRRFHLFIVVLSVYATCVVFRKWAPLPMWSRLLPTFSSMKFSVVEFMLKSFVAA